MGTIQVAGGSVVGGPHRLAGRNSQDAFGWSRFGDGLAAVVADGCGGEPRSELGAELGCRLLLAALGRHLCQGLAGEALLDAALADLRRALSTLAAGMDPGPSGGEARGEPAGRFVVECLLFTLVGLVVAGGELTTFALGDGLVAVDGETAVLGPFPGNQPPYLGYSLLAGPAPGSAPAILHRRPFGPGSTALIASDGAADLGRLGLPLSTFWRDDRCFANPDMVRRRLAVLGRNQPGGGLPDDTTLVVVRGGEA